jgi:O-acetylserine/cysteine efflux transporter
MSSHRDSPLSLAEWTAIAAVVAIWGVNNACAKFATQALPPLFVGGARFASVVVCLFPFVKPPFPPWRQFLPVLLLVGPLHFAVVYWGFYLCHNLSLFSVTLQLWIPLAALFSWLILGERMPAIALFGMVTAFAGVAWLMLDPHAARDMVAVAVGGLASVFWALGTVLVRRLQGVRALKVQACVSLVTAPTLLIAAFATEPGLGGQVRAASWQVWASILFAGVISSVIATVALFWLAQRRAAGRFTPYLLATPLVTALVGVTLLGDVLTPHLVLGALVTLGGVAVVAVAERRSRIVRPGLELESA